MKFGFVMDPLSGLNIEADTTFAFMLAAQKRDHDIFYIRPADLAIEGGKPWSKLYPCRVDRDPDNYYELQEPAYQSLTALDRIFMRKDPPFDVDYLHATHILELAEKKGTPVINKPDGLRTANEKLYAFHFPQLLPDTIVTRDPSRIDEFAAEHGGECVLKPVDGYGGRQVFHLDRQTPNYNAIIEAMTNEGRERTVCQAYLPDASGGDKRIIMLDGQPLGAILRVPREGEFRGNIHVGGRVQKTQLTESDWRICRAVAPKLREDGLWFVGLDVIGDRLTEINLTSPTGIQEMSRLDGVDGAGRVIEWAVETF